ncbi:FkbM family methyltransferase [Methylosinus sp. Ce-a6]|uniref:FkbM family methyltransferase n=1 Tax=Methylosinus sp. Ce-a6 TaxID=2172005 RepID=UPI0013599E43|nr:FkbM family methyltransferase [Methylosinus sp. Ce-a6]
MGSTYTPSRSNVLVTMISLIRRIISDIKATVRRFLVNIFLIAATFIKSNKSLRRFLFDSLPKNSLVVADSNSERFIVNSSDKVIGKKVFVDGSFDFEKTVLVMELLNNNKNDITLVDIGANIGTICIPLVKRNIVKRAIAIEPDRTNFDLLTANIFINGLGELIDTKNMALGEKEEEVLAFELSKTNYGDHRIKVSSSFDIENENSRVVTEVKSTTLDKILSQYDTSNMLIWMDTQGYEGLILAGGSASIKKKIPMVVEFCPYLMTRANSYDKFKAAIISAGYYSCYDLNESRPTPMVVAEETFDRLFEKHNNFGSYDFTDLLII